MRKLTVGILAHVDAGKTTLTEAMLYTAGAIRKLGRVDKKDAFLDTAALERERGITIFSKQARLTVGDCEIVLIDTPGHVDFACETERVLPILDACILVISATEPPRAHTKTLWQLLAAHRIPTVIFVNKTDIAGRNRAEICAELRENFSEDVQDFCLPDETLAEEAAGHSETLMEEYFSTGKLERESIAREVGKRRIFPAYFGSALKCEGVEAFLHGLSSVLPQVAHSPYFGARVFKITRDNQGNRLTHMKITGGVLKAKDCLQSGEFTEKAEQIRLYSSDKFRAVPEAACGDVCTVLGLSHSYAGQGFGVEQNETDAALEPILTYHVSLPREISATEGYANFLELAEEDPALHPDFDEEHGEIRIRLMGEIQMQILKSLIRERFGYDADFVQGKILYKETLAAPVVGSGHFEPLRHYAEVHLLMEPLPEGSGLVFDTQCSTDELSLNWQRLILTHLQEKVHRGVLQGAPLTDMKITLTAGKAHPKHTVGGDFRQATYRAVRQGLMKGTPVLLEPYFRFRIELPAENLGHAMTDLTSLAAELDSPETEGSTAVLTGRAPAATVRTYSEDLKTYTKGAGRITLNFDGYSPCHNTEEVLASYPYHPELDERNPADSVFCANGSGFVVPWSEADEKMHVPDGVNLTKEQASEIRTVRANVRTYRGTAEEDRELERLFEKTYGKIRHRTAPEKTEYTADVQKPKTSHAKFKPRGEEYLLVDGYNVIFAEPQLKALAEESLDHARENLVRMLCNYAGYRKIKVILVFDAYRVHKGVGSIEECCPITIVFTKESQTADAYIERTSAEIAKEHFVRVATSDGAVQMIILGNGALRITTKELFDEIRRTGKEIADYL
ncbi:MAG: NYN domain-containing protein [Clostridia bacterium]|nr:NYN domain-containing protein [Clostridia bacterium]